MHSRLFFITLAVALSFGAAGYKVSGDGSLDAPLRPIVEPVQQQVPCPTKRRFYDVKTSPNPAPLSSEMSDFKTALETDGTTVRLGPNVVVDFSNQPDKFFPLEFGLCVTLTSVTSFSGGVVTNEVRATESLISTHGTAGLPGTTEARTPRSLGPLLKFGKHGGRVDTFLQISCFPDGAKNDGARISGFRLIGPDFGQQTTDEVGIRINRCIGVEISNMEIAGWAGAGIHVEDEEPGNPESPPGRIHSPEQIKIHDNFFHHNQRPNKDGHASGYGVNVSHGAWAQIARNVFDFNRHAITAAGDSGGYVAERNLVLKGGGYHGTFYNRYTHIFDVHGTGCWWSDNLCGDAGHQFSYIANAFQFRKDHAIKIRGKPLSYAFIARNIFPHPGLEDDWGDDAIHLNTTKNVTIASGNVIKFDSFGKYGVCDFDGDAVDDLFLATGVSWWFSSFGEFHWSYLNAKTERLDKIRLGYFDNDRRCDVLAEQNGEWLISSGGATDWQRLGVFGVPLSEVQFGRFDPRIRDHRPGITLQTTHAFRRAPDGQWYVTALSNPDWKPAASSGFSMNKLRFGDFTGDGVTDVLAVVSGRWSISESAISPWRRLNTSLGDSVGNLFIANMDGDNVDDILRLKQQIVPIGSGRWRATLTWLRSRNGIEPWQRWKRHVFEFHSSPDTVRPVYGFAGRFGVAIGGGTLTIDPNRLGHFYSEAETAVGAAADWRSQYAY